MRSAPIRIRISDVAAMAIVDQSDYYARQQNDALSARWEKAVARSIKSLLRMPERGAPCHFQPARLKNLRRIAVPGFEHHLVLYRYAAEQRTVLIVHVLHGARDVEVVLESLGTL